MYQLKTYTLSTAEALHQYATVHWPRHIASMPKFGATVHGFWTQHADGQHRLIALLSFEEGVRPDAFLDAYVASPELAADMEGFDVDAILGVEDLLLEPVAGSPLG
ncbi:NIPSNAP family protein [Serinicoccus kebangsaanensis]|uniref:NIPSNAP family protein n=1 Tax=Serinicoccus kebangsaanensis TaxID=2602069 RepID=UPI00124C73CB|nr:NIPSNAP family protein [Serinicoccus kebangsaanensis]